MLAARLKQYYGRLRRPPGQHSTSRRGPVIGLHAPAAHPQATGPGRASPLPAATGPDFHRQATTSLPNTKIHHGTTSRCHSRSAGRTKDQGQGELLVIIVDKVTEKS